MQLGRNLEYVIQEYTGLWRTRISSTGKKTWAKQIPPTQYGGLSFRNPTGVILIINTGGNLGHNIFTESFGAWTINFWFSCLYSNNFLRGKLAQKREKNTKN